MLSNGVGSSRTQINTYQVNSYPAIFYDNDTECVVNGSKCRNCVY